MPVEFLIVTVWIPRSEQFHGVVAVVFSDAIWRDFSHVVDCRVYDGCVSLCFSHFFSVPSHRDAYWSVGLKLAEQPDSQCRPEIGRTNRLDTPVSGGAHLRGGLRSGSHG